MSGRSAPAASATPAQRRQAARQAAIAAEVRAACDALERAVAAGEAVRDDVRLEIVVDDLGVIAGDLELVARDLEGLAE